MHPENALPYSEIIHVCKICGCKKNSRRYLNHHIKNKHEGVILILKMIPIKKSISHVQSAKKNYTSNAPPAHSTHVLNVKTNHLKSHLQTVLSMTSPVINVGL